MSEIDWRAVQARLGVAVDGVAGPITWGAVLRHMAAPGVTDGRIAELAKGAVAHLPGYGVTANRLRLAHFLGQMSHECGGWIYMREIWGPTPAQRGYEGRASLGNTQPGDGRRFMGRGIIQLTGRANYYDYGNLLGLPLESRPELAEQPEIAMRIAGAYWHRRGLNERADRDDIEAVTRRINGGTNGLPDRVKRTARAKALLA